MGILTYLDDTLFTIYLNYPYIFIHIIPAFFQGVNHKPVIEHERDYHVVSFVFNGMKVNKVLMGLIIN